MHIITNQISIKISMSTDNPSQSIIQKLLYFPCPPPSSSSSSTSTYSHYSSSSHAMPLMDKYTIEQLTNILDRNKIQSIDKVYRSKQDGFNLLEFVRFFLNVIEHQQLQTLYLTISLIDFFRAVSQSSSHRDRLFFLDITNYICNQILESRIDHSQIQSKHLPDHRTIVPNFALKPYLTNPPHIYCSKDELVYKLSLSKIKIDKNKHEGVVTSCYFSGSLMRVFTLDDLSDSIAVYNTNCGLVRKIKPHFSKLKKDIVILAFAYSQRQERIGAVLKDFSINFWDHSDNFQFEKSISTASHCQECQTNIWFFQYFNAWVTSDKTGHLYVWNLETEKPERKIKLAFDTQINDLAVVSCLNLVAVVQQRRIYLQPKVQASQKKKKQLKQGQSFQLVKKQNDHESPIIYLYDFFKGEIATRIELGSQNRNPHTLQYSQNYQVLLSAGYQKKISIFQINKQFLDTEKKGELTGHQSLITSFTILKKSPMVISADDKGKVKIWDIRNYKCVQTLDFRDKTNITKLLDMIELGKIGVLGSRINFVEFDQKVQIQKKIQTKDKVNPLWVQCDYNAEQMIILTKKDIRVIDMKRGVVKNIYCQFHAEDTEITFFKYFQTLQKFVIGNQKGQVKIFCLKTGRLDGKLIDHSSSITHIQYDQQNKIFITMSQDSTIQIQKQLTTPQSPFLSSASQSSTPSTPSLCPNPAPLFLTPLCLSQSPCPSPSLSPSPVLNFQDPSIFLLRQMKNNFHNREITLACVSIYHGFIAIGSNDRCVYIWDYQFAKLIIQIQIGSGIVERAQGQKDKDRDSWDGEREAKNGKDRRKEKGKGARNADQRDGCQPSCMAFINGYSILVIGATDGTVYFVRISKTEQGYRMKTIGIYRSPYEEPIVNITPDLLIKGFTPSKQKLSHCKIYIGHASGYVTCIDLSSKLATLKQQSSVVHKESFNPQRQLRENFIAEIQKNKYQSYKIPSQPDDPIFGQIFSSKKSPIPSHPSPSSCSQSPISAYIFQAHKIGLTCLNILQQDQCLLISCGLDQRIKLWKNNCLICDWNINLPLPFKWELEIKNQQKKKDKIMFALKIIQEIFEKYGSDISINQSKALKVRKLLDKVRGSSQQPQSYKQQHFMTQPTYRNAPEPPNPKIILFQNEFSKKDLYYDNVKKFNFNEVAGPTLREIEVQKKLDLIQKQWSTNKERVEDDNNKLLMTIRHRAQKNQEKEQILQFMQPKNYQFGKSIEREKENMEINSAPFVKNIVSKIQSLSAPKSAKKQFVGNETLGLAGKVTKDNYLSFTNLQKTKIGTYQSKVNKSTVQQNIYKPFQICSKNEKLPQKQQIKRTKSSGYTFQKYFQQKHNQSQCPLTPVPVSVPAPLPVPQNQQIPITFCPLSFPSFPSPPSPLVSLPQPNSQDQLCRSANNFRSILTRMNNKVKQSKKRKIRQNNQEIKIQGVFCVDGLEGDGIERGWTGEKRRTFAWKNQVNGNKNQMRNGDGHGFLSQMRGKDAGTSQGMRIKVQRKTKF